MEVYEEEVMRVQVPNHQTWFIPCHISIRYITISKHPSSIHK
ncbi:hypothetical protein RGQ29_020343 [Quercus rubra]|uniref:Uncharacterized protein n=1 Tax=Quercus rubra TaxID=3512 RepID=A0AAN7FDL8_QUERU|nr:hypothetical protein RGQ29_020343 [Quercus rubra]